MLKLRIISLSRRLCAQLLNLIVAAGVYLERSQKDEANSLIDKALEAHRVAVVYNSSAYDRAIEAADERYRARNRIARYQLARKLNDIQAINKGAPGDEPTALPAAEEHF